MKPPHDGGVPIDEAIRIMMKAERERCAQLADVWSRPDQLRLAAGEMTAQEMRTAVAVAKGIAAAIRANNT